MLAVLAFVVGTCAMQEYVEPSAVRAILPKEGPPFTTSKFAHSFRHSPDAKRIAFLDADAPAPQEGAPEIAKESDRLDFDRVRAKYRIVVTGADGADPKTLGAADLSFDNTHGPAWRADSGAVAVTTWDPYIESRQARVLVADLAGGSVKTVFESKGGPIASPTWSHAGSRLAVVQTDLPPEKSQERAARVLVLGADGTVERTVELPKTTHVAFVEWAPDDSYLVAVSGTKLVTISSADGAVAPIGDVGCEEVPRPCIRFGADGQHFALPCDRGVAVVDVAERSLRTINLGGAAHSLVFRPQANFLMIATVTRKKESLRGAVATIARAGDADAEYHHIPMLVSLHSSIAMPFAELRWTDGRRYLRIEDRPLLATAESLWSR